MTTELPILRSRARVETALHVLSVAAVHQAIPAPSDVASLRAFARNDAERNMPLDDFARLVIARECADIVGAV